MKLLIVAPNWIGDAVMTQPLLALLKRNSSCSITVLAPRGLCAVYEAIAEVDALIPSDFEHGQLQWGARRKLARELRAESFDCAYILPNSFKSALVPWLAGIGRRVGYRGEARAVLLTRALRQGEPHEAMLAHYARLAGEITGAATVPQLTVSEAASRAACAAFGIRPNSPFIALCPGAEYGPAKRWPARHFAALAEAVARAEPDTQVVLVGGPGDRDIAGEITRQSKATLIDLCGHTSLGEAIALLAAATGVVSNDSGLMHVAAALGRPQVAVFGSSDPRHTPPNSARAQVVWLHLDCSPCFARVCPLGHLRCLNEIEPERVRAALGQLL